MFLLATVHAYFIPTCRRNQHTCHVFSVSFGDTQLDVLVAHKRCMRYTYQQQYCLVGMQGLTWWALFPQFMKACQISPFSLLPTIQVILFRNGSLCSVSVASSFTPCVRGWQPSMYTDASCPHTHFGYRGLCAALCSALWLSAM